MISLRWRVGGTADPIDFAIEAVTVKRIAGRAWRMAGGGEPLDLELVSGGRVLMTATADRPAPSGLSGAFEFRLDGGTAAAIGHRAVHLRVAGEKRPFAKLHLPGGKTVRAGRRATLVSRTIRAAYLCRLRTEFTVNRPLGGGEGVIETVALRDGVLHVRGRSRVPVTIRSETARVDLAKSGTEDQAFDLRLTGHRLLWVEGAGLPLLTVRLPPPRFSPLATVRTVVDFCRVPFLFGGNLARFLFRGDTKAGDPIEAFLLRLRPASEAGPEVVPGLFAAAAPPRPAPPADIVLPVFNAADDLRVCLEHLARNTPPEHRVIAIDDASTDPSIAPMLDAFARARPGTLLLRNAENGGFIASVNRGLAESRGHVVLLNSDAFVPPGWIDRLMRPILDDALIASVTPMSNEAEIATAPVICRHEPLAEGQAEAMDAIAQRLNPAAARAESPTGVGFCMAMSRRWLDEVPRFDTAFGRGYGEEVDWCRRVGERGGRHLLIGDLFVEHRGGGSFGPEKAVRIAAASRLINDRYPAYDASVADFIRKDPLVGPRLALGLARAGTEAPLPVYLGHRLGGGGEHWLQDRIARDLDEGGSALVLRDGPEPETVAVELYRAAGQTRAVLPLAELGGYLGAAGRKTLVYSCLVGARAPLDLAEVAAISLGAEDRFRMVFHDYFPLCPSRNLLGHDGRFCDLPGAERCQACYERLAAIDETWPARISDWRGRWHALAARAETIEVFSPSSRTLVARAWPDLAPRLALRSHPLAFLPRPVQPAPRARPVLGVLGSIGFEKGAAVLRDLAAAPGVRMDIVVIGKLDEAYAHRGIRVIGRYRREEISDLAEAYGVGRWLIPSVCPETFSYATHECLATGLPVFAFDFGGQADALRGAPNGHLLPRDIAPTELAARLLAPPPSDRPAERKELTA
ncbi:glycosyltransferase family 2 protein [Rhodovulum visakhapatnamense]|uniref:GT2 family glycosyltransferase n=1 Tax=Rhodovulum visakhapatnamense TaxID=364297 RepID=A0A4R8G724_9RHOB|nr:glycosyltransferase [Rhodovulum visakhapatnamense]TDX31982.1 GT2 family glycosyltransferase [Rhodovulum visakhapatnamense]